MDARLIDQPHRRLNRLTGEWVFVSPHRTKRPWQGRTEPPSQSAGPQYDPECYLCPGNLRANGERNLDYAFTNVFENDFAAFVPGIACENISEHPLAQARTHAGVCRVICFSRRHDLTLAEMAGADIREVVNLWVAQVEELGQQWRWVQLFENKGQVMGCSNAHPHGQVWAGDFVPNEAEKELAQQQAWQAEHGSPLLRDYAEMELGAGERVVVANEHWLVVVPWWAVWPFETLLLPLRPVQRLPELTGQERDSLADILRRLLVRYDNLFECAFPYSMGWHGAPNDDGQYAGWLLHAHFYPPLLRSASIKKFMVGYELLAEAQRDLTPEQAAARLRQQSETHYRAR